MSLNNPAPIILLSKINASLDFIKNLSPVLDRIKIRNAVRIRPDGIKTGSSDSLIY